MSEICRVTFRQCRQLLKKRNMLFAEGCRAGGKNFENSVDPAPPLNRQNGNRTQTEIATDLRINQWIVLGIGAMLNLPAAQTLPADSGLRTQPRTENGSRVTSARSAHHRAVLPHRQRGSGGARQLLGGIRDGREHRVQTVVPGGNHLLQRRQRGALVQIARHAAGPAGGSFRQSIAIQRAEDFPGAKRLGLRHYHSSLSIGKLPDKTGQNASGAGDLAEV